MISGYDRCFLQNWSNINLLTFSKSIDNGILWIQEYLMIWRKKNTNRSHHHRAMAFCFLFVFTVRVHTIAFMWSFLSKFCVERKPTQRIPYIINILLKKNRLLIQFHKASRRTVKYETKTSISRIYICRIKKNQVAYERKKSN
jgi:hypothetical protein